MHFHSRLVAFVATLAMGATPVASQSAIDIRAQTTKDALLTTCLAEASGPKGRIATEITATTMQQTPRAASCAQEYLGHLVGFSLKDRSVDTTPQDSENAVIDDLRPIQTDPEAFWGGRGIWEDSHNYCGDLLDFLKASLNPSNFRYADNGEKVNGEKVFLEDLSEQNRAIEGSYFIKAESKAITHLCGVAYNAKHGYNGISCAKIVAIDRPDVFTSVYNQTLKDMQNCLLPAGWEQNSPDQSACVLSGEVNGGCVRTFHKEYRVVWLYSNKAGPLYAIGIQTILGN